MSLTDVCSKGWHWRSSNASNRFHRVEGRLLRRACRRSRRSCSDMACISRLSTTRMGLLVSLRKPSRYTDHRDVIPTPRGAMSAANTQVVYGQTTIPQGIRSQFFDNLNGLRVHALEAGFEPPG